MSFLSEYITYYFYSSESKIEEPVQVKDSETVQKKYFISITDLNSVNLHPVKNVIPGPSRNMPPMFDKVDLRNLNKAQLNAILNVKLKPTPPIIKKNYFEPRHPVIKELHAKFCNY